MIATEQKTGVTTPLPPGVLRVREIPTCGGKYTETILEAFSKDGQLFSMSSSGRPQLVEAVKNLYDAHQALLAERESVVVENQQLKTQLAVANKLVADLETKLKKKPDAARVPVSPPLPPVQQ